MNTPSPLVPQGTSPDRGKPSLYFKVLLIVSMHVVLIGGMLLQGCKENKSNSTTATGDQTAANDLTNNPPAPVEPPPLAVNTNYAPPALAPTTSSYSATPAPITGTNPMANNGLTSAPAITPMPAPAPENKEYVVARGDTLAAIAKKSGVSLKSLLAANPGVDPRKLKIGAKLQLPESATSSATGAMTAGGAAESGDTTVYTVKAGDMLGRIARTHGTTVAKIKALNDLKTTSIKVGQKLKLPMGKAGNEPATASAPAAVMNAPSPTYATAQPTGATH